VHRLPVAYGLAVLGVASAIMSGHDAGMTELRAVIRVTAFTSAVPFLLVFVASAWHRLRPSPAARWLVAQRRYLGLSVAASHLWHLLAIVGLAASVPAFRANLSPATLVFGGAGFVLLALMAATSTDAAQRALGRGWTWLHTTGLWVLWLDFVFTYVGPAAASPFHAVMTLLFVAALVLRLGVRVVRRRLSVAPDAAPRAGASQA
jgi:methionine sulfoxide reductase heme-binding subunit